MRRRRYLFILRQALHIYKFSAFYDILRLAEKDVNPYISAIRGNVDDLDVAHILFLAGN